MYSLRRLSLSREATVCSLLLYIQPIFTRFFYLFIFILLHSFTSVKNELLSSHPMELPEENFQPNQDKMNFSTLIQGLHALLKLQMEYRAARKIQRLPFLQTPPPPSLLHNHSEMMGEPHIMGITPLTNWVLHH
uniref:Uncharacterized protein n=1 Tax=Cyclopterus lumpus TaxID=8103 RepID=A0A8C2XQ29_CYCLU